MAGNNIAYGAGVGKEETGGKTKEIIFLTEDEIKQKAREHFASWQMPPSGLYIFEIWEISEKVQAESSTGRKYTYRQVLGYLHGQSGNLTYDGTVLFKVIGTQAEIFARIAKSESKKCLIDIRKWNDMLRIQGVYGLNYILQLLQENGDSEAKAFKEAVAIGSD